MSRFSPDTAEEPAGLYLHIPFCRSKCPYCSFLSIPAAPADDLLRQYMAALRLQAASMAGHPWTAARSFASLYIGGGTPTICDPQELAGLIEACLKRYRFSESKDGLPEVTVEANPNTVFAENLRCLRQAGANRLSIGIQSFSEAMLAGMGRTHSRADGIRAMELARGAGFANISLDLMYGLPHQSLAAWQETLEMAVSLAPEHLSLYELTIEEDTVFARRQKQGALALPTEDTVLRMAAASRKLLGAAGYEHYEISNFCRPGYECRHNINYWENGSYLGLGAGAVSCFGGLRIRNVADPQEYIRMVSADALPFLEGEGLPREAGFRETVIMGLRMTAGISSSRLGNRFGLTPAPYYGKTLERLAADRLIEIAGDRLRLTARGMQLANQVLAELV